MAILAIKGHKSRGNEVIEILEMLGGKNLHNYCADCDSLCFYIGKETNIIYYDYVNNCEDMLIFTLEEFLERFPYKIGDKILYKTYGIYLRIKTMLWNVEKEQVFYRLESNKLFVATADELQPYKEEAMDKAIKAVFDAKVQCCDIMNDIIKKDMKEIKINIPAGYEFAGVDDNAQQVVFAKIQPEYPKTYEECCKILGVPSNFELRNQTIQAWYIVRLSFFQQLLICLNAYWEIVGRQMRLGKPWEPDWEDETEIYHTISYDGVNIKCYNNTDVYSKLAFPTEEMRDAFYENFKELINQCKELL